MPFLYIVNFISCDFTIKRISVEGGLKEKNKNKRI